MSDRPLIDENGSLTRAKAPVSGVSVPAHLGIGSDLVHSLDYVVMLQVLFNLAAGETSTPLQVWKQLQARGIRSAKNANELVGKNAVYESFARLIEAGYLRRIEVPNTVAGRRPTIAYEVFDNPAWNPAWQAGQVGTDPLHVEDGGGRPEGNAQVVPRPGTPDAAFGEPGISAGQSTSRNAGSGVRGSGVPGRGGQRVPAGQPTSGVPGRGEASPPHPPGGGGNHPPLPPQVQRGSDGAATPRGREEGGSAARFTAEQVAEAEEFLMGLPSPFTVGWQVAPRLAPLLLQAITATGWNLDDDLSTELTKNPAGVKNGVRALEKYRFPGLVLRAVARQRPRGGQPSPEASAVACDRGCDEGWIETATGMSPCQCMPQRAAASNP